MMVEALCFDEIVYGYSLLDYQEINFGVLPVSNSII